MVIITIIYIQLDLVIVGGAAHAQFRSRSCEFSSMDSGNQNQFFLVVEEILQCRWTFCGDEREGSMYSGCVVVIRPHNRKNEFEVHRGSPFLTNGPGLVIREGGLPQDKVVSITDKEFDILLGSNYNGDVARFQLHSSGRLKWVCQLKVGDEVLVTPRACARGKAIGLYVCYPARMR